MHIILYVNMKFKNGVNVESLFPTEGAKKLSTFPGLIWKIWTEKKATNEGGGIYYFESEEHAQQWIDQGLSKYQDAGVLESLETKIFDILPEHTKITRGPISNS